MSGCSIVEITEDSVKKLSDEELNSICIGERNLTSKRLDTIIKNAKLLVEDVVRHNKDRYWTNLYVERIYANNVGRLLKGLKQTSASMFYGERCSDMAVASEMLSCWSLAQDEFLLCYR